MSSTRPLTSVTIIRRSLCVQVCVVCCGVFFCHAFRVKLHSLMQQNKHKGYITRAQTRCHLPAAAIINRISMASQSLSGQESHILLR